MKKAILKNTLLLSLTSCLTLCNSAYCGENIIDNSTTLINQAKNHIQTGSYQEAIELLNDIIIKFPQKHEPHYLLGQIYKENGNELKASKEFQQAYEIKEGQQKTNNTQDNAKKTQQEIDYIDLANVYLENEQLETALEYFQYAFELNPQNHKTAFEIANTYAKLGKYKEASFFIKKALMLDKNTEYINLSNTIKNELNQIDVSTKVEYNEHYYNRVGVDYFNNEEFEKAEEYFQKAIDTNPQYPQSYNNLANSLYKQGRYSQAITILKSLIKTHPEYSDSYVNLALIYRKNDNQRKELKLLNKAIKNNPNSFNAYYQRALSNYKAGNTNKAKSDLKIALEIEPNAEEALFKLGQIYFKENDNTKASDCFSKIIASNPTNAKAHYYLAQVAKNTNEIEKSIKLINKAISIKKDETFIEDQCLNYLITKNYYECIKLINSLNSEENENMQNYKALAYLKLNKLDLAQQNYEKLIELNPNRPIYHYYFSQCLQLQKLFDRSTSEFEKALSIKPQTVQDYLDLAQIYSERKMYEYQKNVLKEGIKKYPKHQLLNIELANYYQLSGDFDKAEKIFKKYK